MPKQSLTALELATALEKSTGYIYGLARKGRIPSRTEAGKMVFDLAKVRAALEGGKPARRRRSRSEPKAAESAAHPRPVDVPAQQSTAACPAAPVLEQIRGRAILAGMEAFRNAMRTAASAAQAEGNAALELDVLRDYVAVEDRFQRLLLGQGG